MTFDEVYEAVTAEPHNDSLREQLADECRVSDPDRARFIDIQNARARTRRTTRSTMPKSSPEEERLLAAHEAAWSRTLAKYTTHRQFYRGAVESIEIDPFMFLEYGEWLFKLAPICDVSFRMAERGARFPLTAVLASPLLAKLDSVSVPDLGLGDADIEQLAACPHLARCLVLDLSYNQLSLRSFEALAASSATRKLLFIARDGQGANNYKPGERLRPVGDQVDRWGADVWDWSDVGDEGRDLERRYGYIPWLHYKNVCSYFDARWYVDHGILPVVTERA